MATLEPSDPAARSTRPPGKTTDFDPTLKAPSTPAPGSRPGSGSRTGSTSIVPPGVQSADPSARFGKFVRTRKLGSGGMGEVWQAWDAELGRWVALKFLKGGDEDFARFQREAQLAAKLNHPNIAAIYEAGTAQGRHYIAMQFIEGTTLNEFPLRDPKMLVRLLRDAASAVGYANDQGIVHRDLKPENLMVQVRARGREGPGTRSAEAHLFVMDFGLARPVEGDSAISISGSIVGTPSYMAPEQARADRVDEGADVYSLGATLYQALTGRPPFRGRNVYDTLRLLQEEEATAPRSLNPKVDADLETIVLKCLEKERDRRYATAHDLAADLDRYLEGDPVSARKAGLAYRLRRKAGKSKLALGIGLGGLVVVGVALAVLLPILSREKQGKAASDRSLQLWAQVAGLINEAELYSRAGEIRRAREKTEEGIRACRESLAGGEFALGRYFLGRFQAMACRRTEALRELDRALELDPALAEASLERGLLLTELYEDEVQAHIQRHVIGFSSGVGRPVVHVSMSALHDRFPRLKVLRDGAIRDLSVAKGRSSFFREVDQRYGQAELARLRSAPEEARRIYDEVLATDPLHERAMIALGRMDWEGKRVDEALARVNRILERHRDWLPALDFRADVLGYKRSLQPEHPSAKSWVDQAFADYERIIASGNAGAETWFDRGMLRQAILDDEGAVADLRKAVDQKPDHHWAWVALSYCLRNLGRLDEALAAANAAVALDTPYPEGLVNKGRILHDLGDSVGAAKCFDQAIARSPAHYAAYLGRTAIRKEAGDLEGALADARKAVELELEDPSPSYNLAKMLIFTGDEAGADKILESLVVRHPRFANAWWELAVRKRDSGRLEESLSDFDQAIRLAPRSTDAWMHRGLALQMLERTDEAMQAYNEAIRFDPKNAQAWFNRAGLKLERNDEDGGLADFEAAIRANPKYVHAYVNRGIIRASRGDSGGALKDYDRAIELDPATMEAWAMRASLHGKAGDYAKATRDYTEAIRLSPRNPKLLFNRGNLHLRNDDPKAAVADLTAALDIDPAFWPALCNRGDALQDLGDYRGAIADYERALTLVPEKSPMRDKLRNAIEESKDKLR